MNMKTKSKCMSGTLATYTIKSNILKTMEHKLVSMNSTHGQLRCFFHLYKNNLLFYRLNLTHFTLQTLLLKNPHKGVCLMGECI